MSLQNNKFVSRLTPLKRNWIGAWNQPSFRIQFIISLLIILAFGFFFPFFFDYLEARDGMPLNDPLLNVLPPRDVSWMVFLCLYSGILIGTACNIIKPKNLLIALEIYFLVTMMRIFSLSLVALNPPSGYIPLKEPFVALFTNGTRIISKDLFFSGHVSTILAVYFSVEQRQFKNIILFFSIMVGSLLLLQHVHYTIDIIVSPVATFFCSILVKKVFTREIL
jgi:hypothetical protein